MNDDELKAEFKHAEADCLGYLSGTLASERELALKYYLGQPFGNEIVGRSKVVSTDVSDVVEWMLPSLLRVFSAGSETVRFEPHGPEDEAQAKQRTDYANHVFNVDNPGFEILHTWFKDALLQKNGMVKVCWVEEETVKEEYKEGLTDDEFTQLALDDDAELTGHTATDDVDETGLVTMSHAANVRRTVKTGKVKILNIPPEEFLISRNARTIDAARFVGHRTLMTIGEIRAMGVSEKQLTLISAMASPDGDAETTDHQAIARDLYEENSATDTQTADEASRKVWVTDGWLRVDADNDGIAELRHITVCGNEITYNEVDDVAPFADITPCPMPHRWAGRSIADVTMDIQLIKSTLLRNILDSFYLSTTPMMLVDEAVNLDDLLAPRPGGIVRISGVMDGVNNHARPIDVPNTGKEAIGMLEFLDTVRENRTGITKYNQGLDTNSLNHTATGINAIMNASQSRLELIGRHFAEGVKKMFRLIDRTVSKYQQQPRVIRLRNQWVDVDPRDWVDGMDCTVMVGLGTGDKQQQLGALMNLLNVQKEVLMGQAQMGITLVTPQNLYNTFSRMVDAMGFKEASAFFTDPTGQQPQPPAPNPETQALMAKTQAEVQATQAKTQASVQQAQVKTQLMVAQGQAKQQQAQADNVIKLQSARQKSALEQYIAQLDAQSAEMKRRLEMGLAVDEHGAKRHQMELDNILRLMAAEHQREQASAAE